MTSKIFIDFYNLSGNIAIKNYKNVILLLAVKMTDYLQFINVLDVGLSVLTKTVLAVLAIWRGFLEIQKFKKWKETKKEEKSNTNTMLKED